MTQFNDPQCRRAADPTHVCHDKHGEPFASTLRPARSGAVCWFETIAALEDERLAELDALHAMCEQVERELDGLRSKRRDTPRPDFDGAKALVR